jgi:hypothetical protein
MRLLILTFLFTSSLFANDSLTFLRKFESKSYSLKGKGVKDLVVDLESESLTKQVNEQQVFGKIDQLIFRVYWTLVPERMTIEVLGLPEGFKELKDELKSGIVNYVEELISRPIELKFKGYKFSTTPSSREILATDPTGIAPTPSYLLKFDQEDKLVELLGNKPVGTLATKFTYDKKNFTDGKWIIEKEITQISESGMDVKITKDFDYKTIHGVGILHELKIITEKKSSLNSKDQVKISELITFSNFKINEGLAMKHFLSGSK